MFTANLIKIFKYMTYCWSLIWFFKLRVSEYDLYHLYTYKFFQSGYSPLLHWQELYKYIVIFYETNYGQSNSIYITFYLKSTSDRVLEYEINLQMLSEESCFIKSFSDADEVWTITSKVTTKKVWSIMQIIQSRNWGI